MKERKVGKYPPTKGGGGKTLRKIGEILFGK